MIYNNKLDPLRPPETEIDPLGLILGHLEQFEISKFVQNVHFFPLSVSLFGHPTITKLGAILELASSIFSKWVSSKRSLPEAHF